MTDRQRACLDWIRSISPPGVTVVHQHQNAPSPDGAHVSLNITNGAQIAVYRGPVSDEGQQRVTRWVSFTLAIQARGGGPFGSADIALHIADRLEFSELRIEHTGRDMAFAQILNGPIDITTKVDSRWETRTLLELQMTETRCVVFNVGVIEEVHFAGTAGDHEIAGKPSAKTYIP